jgi:hypothetical protein
MGLARYFVFEINDKWLITLGGQPIARHSTRDAAVTGAIVMADLMGAMHHDADVVVDRGGGKLEFTWAYGDPVPGPRQPSGELPGTVRQVQVATAGALP